MVTPLVKMLELVFMLADTEKSKVGPRLNSFQERTREGQQGVRIIVSFLTGIVLCPVEGQTLKDAELELCTRLLSCPPAFA